MPLVSVGSGQADLWRGVRLCCPLGQGAGNLAARGPGGAGIHSPGVLSGLSFRARHHSPLLPAACEPDALRHLSLARIFQLILSSLRIHISERVLRNPVFTLRQAQGERVRDLIR